MLGALVSLVSAFSFSMSDIFVRRGVAKAPASHGAFITVLLGVPLFGLTAMLSGQLFSAGDLSGRDYALLSAAGAVHYVFGRYCNYAAIAAIGAARAGPVQSLALPYSVLIALLFLGESVTAGMAAGIALIFVGPALMVERQPARRPVGAPVALDDPPAPADAPAFQGEFHLKQAEGYVFAALAAVSYGSSPVLIRAALEGSSGLSIMGGFVSYVAAGTLLVASLVLPGRRNLIQAFEPTAVKVFFGAGFFVFLAQLLRFVALSLASVAVVAALLRFTSVFTLTLSWYFNRQLENLNRRVLAGVVISVAGAVLLVTTQPD